MSERRAHPFARLLSTLLLLLGAGCYASHGFGEAEPVAELCCESACPVLTDGNICGVTTTAIPEPVCHSLDLPGTGELLYSNCDESGDCPSGEVCRGSEEGGDYFACQPPLARCEEAFGPGCDYACRGSAECPGEAGCLLTPVEGPCASVGFCQP